MTNITKKTGAFALTMAVGGAAQAGMIGGASVTTPYHSEVSVEFVSQSAGAKGALYFLGFNDGDGITYAASTDSNNLGRYLFHNHGTAQGYSVLLGDFGAGSVMHFAYLITNGVSVAPTGQITRTDALSSVFFAVDAGRSDSVGDYSRVGVEDIVSKSSDMDYNDMIFNVRFADVPAPGGAMLAGLAMLVASPRRRTRKPA